MKTYLNQLNSRWANIKIGNSNATVGRLGCAITSLCMALNAFDIPMEPDVMAKRADWFTAGGLIIWKQVEAGLRKMYPNRTISITRYYGRNDLAIRQNLAPGSAVLLQVASQSHWMLAERKSWLRNDYECHDPWGGVARSAIGNYSNITGYTIVKFK